MSRAIAAAAIAVLVIWLIRRPTADTEVPDTELWGAFDRGEDPTVD